MGFKFFVTMATYASDYRGPEVHVDEVDVNPVDCQAAAEQGRTENRHTMVIEVELPLSEVELRKWILPAHDKTVRGIVTIKEVTE